MQVSSLFGRRPPRSGVHGKGTIDAARVCEPKFNRVQGSCAASGCPGAVAVAVAMAGTRNPHDRIHGAPKDGQSTCPSEWAHIDVVGWAPNSETRRVCSLTSAVRVVSLRVDRGDTSLDLLYFGAPLDSTEFSSHGHLPTVYPSRSTTYHPIFFFLRALQPTAYTEAPSSSWVATPPPHRLRFRREKGSKFFVKGTKYTMSGLPRLLVPSSFSRTTTNNSPVPSASPSSSSSNLDEPVVFSGVLLKRGRRKLSLWKSRFFVLRPGSLTYHLHEGRGERRVLPIIHNSKVLRIPEVHPLAFVVQTPGLRLKITCRAQSEEDFKTWMATIESCIEKIPVWPLKFVLVGRNDRARHELVENYLSAVERDPSNSKVTSRSNESGTAEVQLRIGPNSVRLAIWDTLGGDDFVKLRTLAYPNSDAILLVFSDLGSFGLVETYVKEIRALNSAKDSKLLIILVNSHAKSAGVSKQLAEERAAALDLAGYLECDGKDLDEVFLLFQAALRLAVPEISTPTVSPTATSSDIRRLFFDSKPSQEDRDSDEGSLIDREEDDETEHGEQQEFGFDDFKEDPAYTSKLQAKRLGGNIKPLPNPPFSSLEDVRFSFYLLLCTCCAKTKVSP